MINPIYKQMLDMSKKAVGDAKGQMKSADTLIGQLMGEAMTPEAKEGVAEMQAELKNIMAHGDKGDITKVGEIKDRLINKYGSRGL